jgi:hypothetical protein
MVLRGSFFHSLNERRAKHNSGDAEKAGDVADELVHEFRSFIR